MGKLTARVPHTAAGFTVSTPAGKVVDLGTEFGVEVRPDRTMDVQVFVGAVKVSSAGVDSAGGSTCGEAHVVAGQTVHVETGKGAVLVQSKDNRFRRNLKLEDNSREMQLAAYHDFMMRLKPVVWLRMEGKAGARTLHDETATVRDGKLHWDGPGNAFVDGRVGKGLWLRGRGWGLRDHRRLSQGEAWPAERFGLGLCRKPRQLAHDRR